MHPSPALFEPRGQVAHLSETVHVAQLYLQPTQLPFDSKNASLHLHYLPYLFEFSMQDKHVESLSQVLQTVMHLLHSLAPAS